MPTMKTTLLRYATATAITLIMTLVLWFFRGVLTLANFSLLYLFLVLVVAIRQGTRLSLFIAIVSFLCFNFFLVSPLYTFIVADHRELLDLLIFLIVAVLAGRVAEGARQEAANARQSAYQQDVLYKLTSALNQITDTQQVSVALESVLQQDLGIRQLQVLPHNPAPVSSDQTTLYLALRAGESVYGTLRLEVDAVPTRSQMQLINACTVQAAMALQRIELTERAQQSKSFEEADQLKTALLHAVSHDLRTPITIIKSSASNLNHLHGVMPDGEKIEIIRTIENEADELNKLVGNLLDMSRLLAGAFQINNDWNSLEEVAGDVAARAWQLTRAQRIQMHFPDDLPLVQFDYGLLLQAVGNLVDNALRYEPDGRMVEIRARVMPNEVQVAVINHGPDVPLEERKSLMEPFHPGKDGHIGLGLAIARGIIEAHKGRIWLEDTPGGGATFVFALPLALTEMGKLE